MRRNEGKIPATLKMPVKENISQIILRSGRAYQGPTRKADNEEPGVGDEDGDRLIKKNGRAVQKDELQQGDLGKPLPQMVDPFFLDPEPKVEWKEKKETKENEGGTPNEVPSSAVKQTKSFPYRGGAKKKKGDPVDFLEIFGKLEINLPFLLALKLPPFSRFIKDFIAGKAQSDGKIVIGENVSAVIQKMKLPSKRTDPGIFTLPITIGDVKIEHGMCDLGASINVLPLSVYKKLIRARMVDTKVVIQLAGRSCISPKGVLENVIVKKYTFNIDEAMRKSMDVENLHFVDVNTPLVQECLETELMEKQFVGPEMSNLIEGEVAGWFEAVKTQGLTDQEITDAIMDFYQKPIFVGSNGSLLLASLEKVPEMENSATQNMEKNPLSFKGTPVKKTLKTLPPGLKYAYLGENETLPVIINSKLTQRQEEKLLEVLGRNKKAIGWTLSDLVGISPDLCMHHIRLEEGAKPYRDPQTKLNPNMTKHDKEEIQLDIGKMEFDYRGTSIICRSGSPLILADLKKVSVSKAHAIVVLAEDGNADQSDDRALRTVLSLTGVKEGLQAHKVVELSDLVNEVLVKLVGGDLVETVMAHDVIGRLMIQCARQPGLAQIWEDIFRFKKCEFYIKRWPQLDGMQFVDVLISFQGAIPCGVKVASSGGKIILNPDDSYVLQEGDEILVIADDDDTYSSSDLPMVLGGNLPEHELIQKSFERILLCSGRRDMEDMITVLDASLAHESELWIFNEVHENERKRKLKDGGLEIDRLMNTILVHREGNVVIRSLATLLLIRDIQAKHPLYKEAMAYQTLREDDWKKRMEAMLHSLAQSSVAQKKILEVQAEQMTKAVNAMEQILGIVNGHRVKVFRDNSELCVVEEIPLRMPHFIS
ncbi:ion channel CASTOR-like isoform X5 [Salvia divinorum]|uniref:Ion channel CASTOR-like isoform X5 n=1 Tax=Salvia divinorum TaxID=28513 RepID=A0ABD1ILT7_SALDI